MSGEQQLAENLRDSLLSKSFGPKEFEPGRVGERVSLEIQDCRGHILKALPPMEPKALVRDGFDVRVRADRGCKVTAYIRYIWYRAPRPKVQGRYRLSIGPLYRGGMAIFTVKPASPVLSGLLTKLRSRIRASTKMYRNNRAWKNSSTLRDNPEAISGSFVSWDSDYGVPFRGMVNYYTYYRQWAGVRTPNFGKLKGRRLPVNPHWVNLRESWTQPAMVELWAVGSPYESFYTTYFGYWGYGPDYWTEVPSHLSTPYNKALSRLIETAELDTEANLAQDIVQLNNTLKVFVTTTSRIAKSVLFLKHGNISGAIKSLWGGHRPEFRTGKRPRRGATLADNWLEMQYGWKPLLQDVHGAMRSLAYYMNNEADNLVRSISASASSVSETQTPITDPRVHQTSIGEFYEYTKTHVRIGIRYRVGNATTQFLSQTGFTNPLNLAWEVLPFSFVADWFLPVGPYLQALHAWDGLVFLDGFLVQFTRRIRSGYISWGPGRIVWYDSYDTQYAGEAMGEGIRFDRTKLSSFPSPRIPSFKNPLSVTHALNGVALMRSLFAGGTKWKWN